MKDLTKAGWEVRALGEVCEAVSTGPFGSLLGKKDYVATGVPLVNPIDIVDDVIRSASVKHVSSETAQRLSSYRMQSGDIVVARRGELGRCAKVTDQNDGWLCGTGSFFIRPRKTVSADYLVRYIRSPAAQAIFEAASTGATMPNISNKTLSALPIPLPPLEEQQRIVAVLDEAFEGLARARAHAEANLHNARELFESYLANVFGEGDWQEKTLDQISENLDRVRVPITKSKRVAGDIPYYGASGVVDHVADYLFDEDLLLISEDGANLLARTYPIAFSISGKSWVNNHAHVLRFDDPDTQEFVRLYLNSISLEPYVSGMAQPKLNQKQLNRIPIPFPDGDMRTEIVGRAHAISEETQRLERNFEAALQDLDDLRQSLLQKAFAGELT